jgi:glyoxylase-like metal-dependent hydrolase (beta-lactamase superfamily II)
MHRFRLGSATVTVLNAGDIRADLAEWYGVRAADWPQYRGLLAQPIAVPMNAVHIALGGASVLVDAPRWHVTLGEDFIIPGYIPPPDLPAQLQDADITPESITHVIITHAHFDHFNGLLLPSPGGRGGGGEGENLTFPNAWHYIGRADWEAKLRDGEGEAQAIFAALDARNQLMRVARDLPIADGITILAAPGETPGHQIVRVQSQGQTLFVIGDLYHHEVEFAQPDWHVTWADAAANRLSQVLFVTAGMAEQARFVAGHIRGVGQFQRATNEVVWQH